MKTNTYKYQTKGLLIDLNDGALSRGQHLTPEDRAVSTLLERHRNVMPSWIPLHYDEPR